MPQTAPAHFLVPRKLTDAELAQAIRLDIEAELDAMNLYQSHIDSTDNETAQKVLRHILDEEREHAALFWALLKQLDPKVAGDDSDAMLKLRLISEGKSEDEIRAALAASKAGAPAAAEAAPEQAVAGHFTVGPLRRKQP